MILIEVEGCKGGKKSKDGFFWHEVTKKKSEIDNPHIIGKIRCGNGGFDSYSNALRAARTHNRKQIKKLPIYHRGKLVG